MRKFVFLAVFSAFCAGGAFAAGTFNPGSYNECWLEEEGNDEYWFCGKQSSESCHGIAADKDDVRHYFYKRGYSASYGDTFTHNNRNFVCCNGVSDGTSNVGKFIEYTDTGYNQYATKTLEGGGKCTMVVNPCYNAGWRDDPAYIISDCTTAGEHVCVDGKVPRRLFNEKTHAESDGRCVAPCANGEAYQSYNTDACVECKDSPTKGKDNYGTCVSCNSDSLFMPGYQYGSGADARDCAGMECCIKKSDMSIASHPALAACYRCPQNADIWTNCLKGELSPDDLKQCGMSKQIQPELRIQ